MNGKLVQDARRAAFGGDWLHRSAAAALRSLLPACCALCGDLHGADEMLCAGCAAQFFGGATATARCRRCANPLPGADFAAAPDAAVGPPLRAVEQPVGVADLPSGEAGARRRAIGPPPGIAASQLCGACSAHPPAFDVTLVATDYAIPVDQLVLQLKFGHRLALAALFAKLLRDAVLQRPDFVLPSLLCPVPLGPRRLAERGYNQSLEIARPLARSLGVALHPRLTSRVRETVAQSSIAPEQRQQNIAGAFAIPDAALVQGRHIGIVDDVMTSGRTLNELAATLKRHGAARVSNLVFARTPPH